MKNSLFNKIKRDFLLLNMAIISILLLLVCAYIYFSMRFNIYSQINDQMFRVEETFQSYYPISVIRNSYLGDEIIKSRNDDFLFIVDISENYTMDYFSSTGGSASQLTKELIKICSSINSDLGVVKYEDKFYYFSKNHFTNNSVRLIVLDVTSQMSVLNELSINLLMIEVISLFLIFIISSFFTNKSVKPLEEAFMKQKNFISNASHELKTPLAVIKTNLDVLNNSVSLKEEDKKWLRYANEEIDQMSKMVNEFLYLAKMENNKEENSFTIVDLSSTVNGVLLSMEAVAFEKHITVDDDIAENVFVRGNADELKRLIVILVDNAIKYCNENGDIVVKLSVQNNSGFFLIKNTGTVISVKDKNIIFERFYRANKERERKSQSYGIGLSIAKFTCEKHGFNIRAYPEVDKTCMRVGFKIANKV